MMKRREFITLLGGAAAAWPLAAHGQQPAGMRRIGVIMALEESSPATSVSLQQLRDGLHGLGWTEGKNLQYSFRFGGGDPERARAFAKELANLQLDLIVAHATPT